MLTLRPPDPGPNPEPSRPSEHDEEWLRLEERALARLSPEDRDVFARVQALFPERGRPRRDAELARGEGGGEPLSVSERQAQYKSRQRLVEALALEAGYRSPADFAVALLREPANQNRLREVRKLGGRPDLLLAIRAGRVTAQDVEALAQEVLRVAYRRWTLPPHGLPMDIPTLATSGSSSVWTGFTPLGSLPPGAVLPSGSLAMLLVQPVDEAGEPLARQMEPADFEYLVRLEAGRLDCRLVLRLTEARALLAVFSEVDEGLAAARAIRSELRQPPPGMHFRMALHVGPLTASLGGFPSRELHVAEALLLLAVADQVLLSGAAQRQVGPASAPGAIRPLGRRVLPVLEEEQVYELEGRRLDPGADEAPLGAVFERLPRLPFVAMPELVGKGISAVAQGARLVTFVGPGGGGATRVAFQVAVASARHFPDGVRIVDLAAIVDRGGVAKVVAEALQVRTPGADVLAPLIDHLQDRKLLLVLDSCDRALMECQRLLEDLLPRCPGLTVIATAVEPLSLLEEESFNLRPLSLAPVATGLVRLVDLDSSEAGRLFTTKVQEVDPHHRFTEPEAGAVATVCWLVQGLPMAIELVAAMTASAAAPPAQQARDLTEYLEHQTGAQGPALPRDRLLQLAISWCLEKLSQHSPGLKQTVLVLSLFPADFDARAAAFVCGAVDSGATFERELRALVRQGFVRPVEDAEPGARYRIPESIRLECDALRRYGERLVIEIEQARARFCTYFADLLARDAEKEHGPDPSLKREIPSFRAALLWSQSPAQRSETWPKLAGAYARFLLQIGHTEEAERIVNDGLDRWARPDTVRQHLLAHAALIAWRRGDLEQAERFWTESADVAKSIGDLNAQARSLDQLGMAALSRGDYPEASRRCEEGIALARRIDQTTRLAFGMFHLGLLALRRGDIETARRHLETSLELRRGPRPDPIRIAGSLLGLTELAIAEGDLRGASLHLRQALTTYASRQHRVGIASALCLCSMLAAHARDPERAVRLFAAAERMLRDMGQRVPPIWRSPVAMALEGARAVLSQRALQIAEERGRDMDDQRAIEYAESHLATRWAAQPPP